MEKKHSLKVNAIFNALYQVLILIVPIITTPYISRILGADNNGIYANFYSIVQYFVLVTTFGFVDFGTKKIAEFRDNKIDKARYFYSIFLAKIVLGSICLISYIIMSYFLFGQNYFLFSLVFSFYILSSMIDPTFYFQGEERFVSICVRNLILKIISTILIFVFVNDSNDLFVYALILAFSQMFSILIIFPSIKFKELGKIKFSELQILDSIKSSFAYFVPSLAVTLFSYVNQTLIGFFGKSDAESGYYAQAVKIIQILASIASSLNIIMLSRISYLNSINDENQIKDKIKKSFEVFWVIACPIMFGLCSIARIFIPLFLGSGYEKCVVLIYILSPTIIIGPINGLYGNLYFRPKNKIRQQTYIILFSAFINLILCFCLIPKFESIGTSIGRITAEFMQLPLLMFFSRRYMDNKLVLKTSIKPLISGLIMFTITFLLQIILEQIFINDIVSLIIIIFIGVFIYLFFEIIFKESILIKYFKDTINFLSNKFIHKN